MHCFVTKDTKKKEDKGGGLCELWAAGSNKYTVSLKELKTDDRAERLDSLENEKFL